MDHPLNIDELLDAGYDEYDIEHLTEVYELLKSGDMSRRLDEVEDYLGYGRFDKAMLRDTFDLRGEEMKHLKNAMAMLTEKTAQVEPDADDAFLWQPFAANVAGMDLGMFDTEDEARDAIREYGSEYEVQPKVWKMIDGENQLVEDFDW